MNVDTYKKTPERVMLGTKVRGLVPLSNAIMTIPTGTVFTIERKFNGLWLKSEPCPACGVSVKINYVDPAEVEAL